MKVNTTKKILIIYDSPAGSTAEVARIIAKCFITKGFDVTSVPVKDALVISGFDLIIIGSPILYGKMSSPVKKYLRNNSEALSETQHVFFLTCMRLTECADLPVFADCYRDRAFNGEKKKEKEMSSMEKSHSLQYYLNNIIPFSSGFNPVKVAFFKGNLDFSKLKFFSRLVMKLMVRLQDEVNEGDFLDKNCVEEWAESITDELSIFGGGLK